MGGKKIMGLPLYVWLGVAAGGLLLGIYLRRKGSSSGTGAAATSYPISLPPSVSSDPGSIDNGVAGGGLPKPSVNTYDPSTVNDLLAGLSYHDGTTAALTEQTRGLTDAIGSLVFSMGSSGGSGASAAGNGNTSPVTNTPTKPKSQPKPPTKKPAAAKPTAVVPIHYFTYKKDVPLKKGQTLHFSAGKGYYGG